MNSKCHLNNIQFPCKICRLNVKKMPKQSNLTYVITWFTLNVITSTILTTNTFKVQMILGFVLPVAVLSSHLHLQIIIASNQPSLVINNAKQIETKQTLLLLNPSPNLSILLNQFNDTRSEVNDDPGNVVNSKYYGINEIQSFKSCK